MKTSFLIVLAFMSSTWLCAANAHAQGSYYLEIGDQVKEAQAQKDWRTISAKHPKLLKDLWYYPKAVYQAGVRVGTRIQAGPIENKDNAQTICKKLFAENTPCFVIENFQKAPPKAVISITEKAQKPQRVIRIVTDKTVPLPWHTEQVAKQAENKEEDSGSMWSWLVGDDSDDNNNGSSSMTEPAPISVSSRDLPPANVSPSSGKAEVDVAEAIRVPLSSATTQSVTEVRVPSGDNLPAQARKTTPQLDINTNKPLPSVSILDASPVVTTASVSRLRRAPVGNPSSDIVTEGAGWLNVASFRDESHASATWQRVRKAVPAKAAGLRVRIVRPFVASSNGNTSLNVGPFANDVDAMDFCNEGIIPVDNSLSCQFNLGNSNVAAIQRRAERFNLAVYSR